jgi:hypothetical protein
MIAASASIFVFGISLIVVLGISVSYTVCAKRYKTLVLLGISHSAKPSSIKAASHFAMILSKS